MDFRKCSNCGNQVNGNDNICSNCGNQLIIFKGTETNEIMENIETIKLTSKIIKNLFIVFGSIILLICLFIIVRGVNVIAILCGITGCTLLFLSRFIEAFIEWKAYMLETNYKIVKNMERDKNGFNKL